MSKNAITYLLEDYEYKFRALQILGSEDTKAYESVIKSIFEYWDDTDLTDVDPDDLSIDDQGEYNTGMTNEITSNEKKNPLSSNIAKIRQFLSTIPIMSNSEIAKFVNPKFAVKRLLEIVPNHIDFNSLHTFDRQIENLSTTTLFTGDSSTKAILNEMRLLVRIATQDLPNKSIEVFVDSSKSIKRPTIHIMYSPSGQDISYMSPLEVKDVFPDTITYQSTSPDLGSVIVKANNTLGVPISNKDFNEMYIRANAIELIRNFQTTIGSLATIEYMKGEVTQSYGTQVEFKYFEAKGLGAVQRVTANIDDALEKLYTEKIKVDGKVLKINSPWLEDNIKSKIKSTDTLEQVEGLKSFLSILGYKHIISKISHESFITSDEFSDMVDGVRSLFKYVLDKATPNDVEKFMEDWKDQSSLKSAIVRFLSSTDEIANIDVIISSTGDKVYTKIPTTTERLNYKHLQEYHSNPAKELADYQTDRVALSPFNTEFFQHNIFVNKINTIHNYNGRHDGYVSKGGGRDFVTDSKAMSESESLLLEFGLQYLHTLGLRSDNTYFQKLYQLGESTKSELVRVGILDEDKIREALSSMIDQLDAQDSNLQKNDGYSKSHLNFEFYSRTKGTKAERIEGILDLLAQEAIQISNLYNEYSLPLPSNLGSIYKKNMQIFDNKSIVDRLNKVENIHKVTTPTLETVGYRDKKKVYFTRVFDQESQQWESVTHDPSVLRPLIYSWVINRYVNAYGLTQIALGDFNMYKDNLNLSKRSSGAMSPGTIPLVHSKYGLPTYGRIFVINDEEVTKSSSEAFLRQFDLSSEELDSILSYYPESYERTDGASVMTPRAFNLYRKAFGSNYDLREIMKDQYFGNAVRVQVDKSKPYDSKEELLKDYLGEGKSLSNRKNKSYLNYVEVVEDGKTVYYPQIMHLEVAYLKNSIFVITPDIQKKNPKLAALAKFMDSPGVSDITGAPRSPIDILTFRSGNKLGNPTKDVALDTPSQELTDEQMNLNTRIIDNRTFKMQYNPYSLSATTALPTQLVYFVHSLGTNEEFKDKIAYALTRLQELGLQSIKPKFANRKSISNFVKSSISTTSDNYVITKLIEAGLTIDHPAVEKYGLIALGSAIEKATIRVRIPGSKLSLQSPVGFVSPKTGEPLAVKPFGKGMGPYAEALIHADLLDENMRAALEAGVDLFVSPELLGFRIPTSELHSSTAIKIVGTHYEDNYVSTIIMPQELIPIQGWDFDIDSLFILKRTPFSQDITIKGTKYSVGDYIGYSYDSQYTPNFEEFEKDINTEISLLEKEISSAMDSKISATPEDVQEISEYISKTKTKLRELQDIQKALYSNLIVDSFIQVTIAPQNKSRMLTPISTDIFTKEVIPYLQELGIYSNPSRGDLGLFRNDYNAYSTAVTASKGIGIIANGMKQDSYTRSSSSEKGPLIIKNKANQFIVNGTQITQFSEDIQVFGKEYTNYQVKDTVLNLYLDALKNPLLYPLGWYGSNAAIIDLALSLKDFPLKTIVLLFNLPYVKKMFQDKKEFLLFSQMRKKDSGAAEIVSLTDKELLDMYKQEDALTKSKIDIILFKLNQLSRDRSKLMTMIGSTQSLVTSREQLYSLESDINAVIPDGLKQILSGEPIKYSETFGLDAVNFLNDNPRILSSLKVNAEYKKIIDNNFWIYTPQATKLASFGEVGEDYSRDKWEAKVERHRKVSDFILRSLVSERISNHPKVKYDKYIIDADHAFIYSLMEKIKIVQARERELLSDPKYSPNKFLSQIIMDRFRIDTIPRIRIGDGFNIAPLEYDEYYSEFDKLSSYAFDEIWEDGIITGWKLSTINVPTDADGRSQFQKDLLDYSLLANGLRIANNNYNKLINPRFIYSQTGDINSVYSKALGSYQDILIPFAISTALQTIDRLPPIFRKLRPNEQQREYLNSLGVVYDSAMVKDLESSLPFFVKSDNNQVQILVKEIKGDTHLYGLYQTVGDNSSHILFPSTPYDLKSQFRTDYPTTTVTPKHSLTIGATITEEKKYIKGGGQTEYIYFRKSSDLARYSLAKGKKISEEDTKVTYEIIPMDPLAEETKTISMSDILYNQELDNQAEDKRNECK